MPSVLLTLYNVVLMLTNVVFYAIELKRGDVAALSISNTLVPPSVNMYVTIAL